MAAPSKKRAVDNEMSTDDVTVDDADDTEDDLDGNEEDEQQYINQVSIHSVCMFLSRIW